MSLSLLACTKCKAPLLQGMLNRDQVVPCAACAAPLQVEVFPALFRRAVSGRLGEAIVMEDESACFYHPQKRAEVACEACGRFLCAVCDCELHGQHFCPACLETGRNKGKIQKLENQRTLYDSTALSLALIPLLPLFWFFTIVTAPLALYMAIRYWNAPRSIVHRTKIRYVVAIIFAVLQIITWGVVIYFGITS